MSVRAVIFPDSEAVAVTGLRAQDLDARTDLVGWRAGDSRVVVTRIGGVPSLPFRIDNPRLDVDCYADSKEAAHDLAQQARVALHELPNGDHTALGAVVSHVTDDTGLQWLPDPDTSAARYTFAVRLSVHPHP